MNKIKEIWAEKPIWLRVLLVFLGTYVLKKVILRIVSIVGTSIYNISSLMEFIYNDSTGISETAFTYAFVAIMFVAAVVLTYIIKPYRPILKTLGKKCKGNTCLLFLIGSLVGLITNSFVVVCALLCGDITLQFFEFNLPAIVLLFVAVLVQCLAEEYVHRGIMLQVTAKYFKNPILILGLNAILFGIGHGSIAEANINGVITLVLLGLLCAAFVYYFDSFWAATAIHGLWNFSQSILWGLPNSGTTVPYSIYKLIDSTSVDTFAYSPSFGPEGTVLAIITLAIACIIVIGIGIKNKKTMTNIWTEK